MIIENDSPKALLASTVGVLARRDGVQHLDGRVAMLAKENWPVWGSLAGKLGEHPAAGADVWMSVEIGFDPSSPEEVDANDV